jgi:hypothetical protein
MPDPVLEATEAARAAHPDTFRHGVVVPGKDGVPELIAPLSTNIHGIGAADGALFLRFPAGKVYRYTSTAEDMDAHGAAMLKAESAGKYFAQNLRHNPRVVCVYLGRVHEASAPGQV